jgi:putative membrane protein
MRLTRRVALGRSFAIQGALIALSVAWIWPLREMARDLFAAHMLQHLLVMNVAALLIAVASQSYGPRGRDHVFPAVRSSVAQLGLTALPVVTAFQLGAFWIWHMPTIFSAAHHNPVLHGLMQLSLFAAALLFWRAVLGSRDKPVWHKIFALLITAKIFCLLGATFVFSRRTLYPSFGSPEAWGLSPLEDQQLSGLLMVSSCPLVYVAAAIALFARWLAKFESFGREAHETTYRPMSHSLPSEPRGARSCLD